MNADALAAAYATIPHIECKGLCARSCGPILAELHEADACGARYDVLDLSDDDLERVRSAAPKTALADSLLAVASARPLAVFRVDRKMRCNLLRLGRCTAYDDRPAICRLWGVVESMPCLWGCVPERMLTHAEGHAILDAVRDACA